MCVRGWGEICWCVWEGVGWCVCARHGGGDV